LKFSVATVLPWLAEKLLHKVLLVKVTMAADAAWVITTVIAAAEKAIRMNIEETPKGSEGKHRKQTGIMQRQ